MRRKGGWLTWLCLCLLGPWSGCAHVVPRGARPVALGEGQQQPLTEAELQQEVQRFATAYFDRIAQAAAPLSDSQNPDLREQGTRRILLLSTSALEIATGPTPDVNLLDMLVFVTLTRYAYERYWMPKVLGKDGLLLLRALQRSELDCWELARRVLSPQQEQELRELIRRWRDLNPEQVRVEGVRLAEFSKFAGDAARARKARGILASVKSATHAADDALLLGERAMFLAQRAPFLLRLQTRLGVQESINDGTVHLARAEVLIGKLSELEPLLRQTAPLVHDLGPTLQELTKLSNNTEQAAREARLLSESVLPIVHSLEPLLAPRVQAEGETQTGLEQILSGSNRLAENTLEIVRELQKTLPSGGPSAVEALLSRADRAVGRWLMWLALLGAGWALVFWGGYYAAKRGLARHARER